MILQVSDLSVDFTMPGSTPVHAVTKLDLDVPDAGSVAIVGESGSGKSVSMRSLLGLLPGNAVVRGRAVLHLRGGQEIDLLSAGGSRLRRIRGREVGMVFQNAMEALNPSLTLERQLTEHLIWHGLASRHEAKKLAVTALGDVGIPEPERRITMYPFQFSGGMRQRAMIAMATVARPRLVIADEPTTALDVTVQKQILDLLTHLRDEGAALVMITHDLGVARYLTDEAVVLRHGEVQEKAPMTRLLTAPAHPYTRVLLDAAMDLRPVSKLEEASDSAGEQNGSSGVLVSARDLVKDFPGRTGPVRAVDGVSFDLHRGRTLGVVGESGSGKSTLARLVLRLIETTSGTVEFDGRNLLAMKQKHLRIQRRSMQMVFQSPFGSLLPASTIAANIEEPLRINRTGTPRTRRKRALELLDLVKLPSSYADLYARQLSGGEQQRVAIARALALEPELLIADEPTSALDASVQVQVLELLEELQEQLGFSVLLITHNLAVVERFADEVAVMRSGRIVERGRAFDIFATPQEEYTRTLLDAVLPVHGGRAE